MPVSYTHLLQGIPVPEKGKYGTGLLFLPKDGKDQAVILSVIIEEIEKEGLTLMHLRLSLIHISLFPVPRGYRNPYAWHGEYWNRRHCRCHI